MKEKILELDAFNEPEKFRQDIVKYPQIEGQVRTYYSGGDAERPNQIKKLLEDMQNYYNNVFNVSFELSLLLLKEEDLEKYYNIPYGIPFCDIHANPLLVFLPHRAEGVIVDGALSQKDKVSHEVIKRLETAGYSYEEATRVYVDCIGFHEVGHTFTLMLGIDRLNDWFEEFMATYFSYNFLMRSYPNLAGVYLIMADVIFDDISTFDYRKLDELDRNYMEIAFSLPNNYDWYQKKFTKMVAQVHESEGIDFIHKIIELFKGKAPTTKETNTLLEQHYPQFKEWFETFK